MSSQRRTFNLHRRGRCCAAWLLSWAAPAQAAADDARLPSAYFVQIGAASDTRETGVGLVWDWTLRWPLASGEISGYWDASVSRWTFTSPDGRQTAWLAQTAATPVLRWRANAGASPWFAEAGIGATFTTNVYQTDRKRFSTSFNFGDHIAIGCNVGAQREHELALRVEHFSNAGIKHPNPGEDFVQLRYVRRFR